MYLQDATKGRGNKLMRRLHKSPLNMPEVDFQMLDIPTDFFSRFFGNTSEDT
jgi:hypothetical protein